MVSFGVFVLLNEYLKTNLCLLVVFFSTDFLASSATLDSLLRKSSNPLGDKIRLKMFQRFIT